MFRTLLALLLVVSLALTGCVARAEQEPDQPEVPQETNAPPDTEVPGNKLHFIEGELELSDEIREWMEALLLLEGVYTRIDGKYIHILVAMGEQRTGGYAVELENICQTNEEWVVQVRFIEPEPGSMVTEAITYPYLLVSLETDMDVRVWLLNDQDDPSNMHVYRYDDVELSDTVIIDSPVPFTGVEGTIHISGRAMTPGTITVELEDGHNYLIEPVTLNTEQEGEWKLFSQSLSYHRPSSPMGTLVITAGNETILIPVRFADWSYDVK